ncbi:MAG: hypothetical protein IKR49_09000 [Clostridia bacterium]|nr:hypothetical protein [Clostridia bacterium]
MQKKSKFKTVLIIVLAVLLVIESCVLIFGNKSKDAEPAEQPHAELDVSNVPRMPDPEIAVEDTAILKKVLGDKNIGDMLRGIIYSNGIVSALMSAVYPMLYEKVESMLDLVGFINLFPTGPLLAGQLGDVSYTAVDKDGVRKPLTDVLRKVGSNWDYMNTKVKWTTEDENGEKTEHEDSIYNSIDWLVHDEASFYQAMNDVTLGFRGLLEVSIQSKTNKIMLMDAAANMAGIDFLASIPLSIEAAKVYNPSEMTGYQAFFVYLFNILGLVDGEYLPSEVVCSYGTMGEMWKAIIESVIYAVEKIMTDPAKNIANVLVTLVESIDSGRFMKRFLMTSMYLEYNPLVKKLMNAEDGEQFNLGGTINDVAKGMGVDLSSSWSDLIGGVIKMIGGDKVKVPAFNTKALIAAGTPTTLPNGNKVYKANPDKVTAVFVDYLMQGEIIDALLAKVNIFSAEDNKKIVKAFNEADAGLSNLLKVVFSVVLANLI